MAGPKWPNRLMILRHGLSEQNVAYEQLKEGLDDKLNDIKGVPDQDIFLSPIGRWQAEQTGKMLATYPQFDVCISSPYERSLDTAYHLISHLPYKLSVTRDNRLREQEYGRFHNMSKEEILEQFPEEFTKRELEGKVMYRRPDGENYPDVEERIRGFISDLTGYPGKNVLVVTHHVPYVLFRAAFEDLDEKGVIALGDVPNCGIQEYLLETWKVPEGSLILTNYNVTAYDPDKAPKPSSC